MYRQSTTISSRDSHTCDKKIKEATSQALGPGTQPKGFLLQFIHVRHIVAAAADWGASHQPFAVLVHLHDDGKSDHLRLRLRGTAREVRIIASESEVWKRGGHGITRNSMEALNADRTRASGAVNSCVGMRHLADDCGNVSQAYDMSECRLG
jgi:hypothetical protein